MAVVKVGQVKVSLGKALAYVGNSAKTDGGRLVSSNFAPTPLDMDAAEKSMLESLERTRLGSQEGSVLAHHVIQSFDPDDVVDAETVHQLGVELAERITHGDHKYVVATHVDKGHLHNHIVICAADDMTHKKLRVQKDTLGKWRAISDEQCRQHGLSVVRDNDGSRVGRSMKEIYTTAKGESVKNQIRALIDVHASHSGSFAELKARLKEQGIEIAVRGRHLTFTHIESGLRVRDTRLGGAYDETNIMARISREDSLAQVSFNQRLIAERSAQAVTVILPGTGGEQRITIPADRIVKDGRTYRAYLGSQSEQVVTDRRGRYVETTTGEGLYRYFSEPDIKLEALVERKLSVSTGVSPAQQRFYRAQGHRLDRLRDSARALGAVNNWARGSSLDTARRQLRDRIRQERADLQATVVSLAETIAAGGAQPADRTAITDDIEQRERRITELETDLEALEKVREKTTGPKETEPIRTRGTIR